MKKYVTTSWDDGGGNDLRMANLLERYRLKGTFYIPQYKEGKLVVSDSELVELSERFEVGGHTLSHTVVTDLDEEGLIVEIKGCYEWIGSATGINPVSFAFPKGRHSRIAKMVAGNVGFKYLRTTEMLNVDSSPRNGLYGTTVQVFNHPLDAFLRNCVTNSSYLNLRRLPYLATRIDVIKVLEGCLDEVERVGGCVHVWGHANEIEEYGLWGLLERIFELISQRGEFEYVENRDLLNVDCA